MLQVIDTTLATAPLCLDPKGPDALLTYASRCHFFYLLRLVITSPDHSEVENKKYGDYIIFAGILFHKKALKTAYAVRTNKYVLDFLRTRQNISIKFLDSFTFRFVYGMGFLNITSRFLDKPVCNAAGSIRSLFKDSELSCALLC